MEGGGRGRERRGRERLKIDCGGRNGIGIQCNG